jgi:colanic acid/amylovoran biosynthesis glycosyltransferase
LKLAYLLNSYPMTSTTFIRREINALESVGLTVHRFAVRKWDGPLVENADLLEQGKTTYLLTGRHAALLWVFLWQSMIHPVKMCGALSVLFKLWRHAGGFVRHCAYLMQAASFKRSAQMLGITHVHAHFATNATAVCVLSKHLGGPDYSFTVHGPDEFVDSGRLSYPIKVQHAKFVVAISHFCRSQIALVSDNIAQDKIVIARCGLDFTQYPCDPPLFRQGARIVCVGRLCPQKGQLMIPKLASKLISEFPDLEILLVGDGESRPLIEAEILKLGLSNCVKILGWKNGDDVRRLIEQSRAMILPSSAEGLPVVIMEAMALHCPVISTFIAGIPELVNDECGWLVPAGSLEDLHKAVRALLKCSDEDLHKKVRVGRARVEAQHDIHKTVNLLLNLFSGKSIPQTVSQELLN